MALINKLTAIADAIRGKTGKTEEMTLDQMVTEIEGISGGGGDELFNTLVDRSISGKVLFNGTKVGRAVFSWCTGITEVEIPNATEVGLSAFQGCSAIRKVNAPNLTRPQDGPNNGYYFDGCTNLEEFNAPNLQVVGYQMFNGCNKISVFNFPKLTELKNWAFYNCGIEIANFPLVTKCADRAFNSAKKLKIVNLPLLDFKMSFCFINCTALEYAILGNPTSLTSGAFQNTSTINLILPNKSKVTKLEDTSSIDSLVAVYVPSVYLSDYKNETNWASIADKIHAIEDNETILSLLNKYGYEY